MCTAAFFKLHNKYVSGVQVLESRALYNLGNGYHSKGKQLSLSVTEPEPGVCQEEVEEQVREALEQAARHYE